MKYQKQLDELRELVLAAKGPEDVQARVVISLHKNLPHYNWVGIYRLEGQNLVLGPFQGKPTEHVSIPVGRGICGAAAVSKKTEVVPTSGPMPATWPARWKRVRKSSCRSSRTARSGARLTSIQIGPTPSARTTSSCLKR